MEISRADSLPIHLLVSTILTDAPLPNAMATNSKVNKLAQFLSALKTWERIRPATARFFVELGPDYEIHSEAVYGEINNLFPEAQVSHSRLSTYEDWKKASGEIDTSVEYVLVQGNHDHAYIPDDLLPLEKTLIAMQRDGIVKANITHWPQAIGAYRLDSTEIMKKGVAYSYASAASGTDLVTREFFESWWREDFTQGHRITRPDNPWGPNVIFSPTRQVVPSIELFRHMDGYKNVSIHRWPANELRPNSEIQRGRVVRETWSVSMNYFRRADVFQASESDGIPRRDRLGAALGLLALTSSYRFRPHTAWRILRSHGFSIQISVLAFLLALFNGLIFRRIFWEVKFHTKWHYRKFLGLEIGPEVYR